MTNFSRDDFVSAASTAEELSDEVFDAKADALALEMEAAIERNKKILQNNDVFETGRHRRNIKEMLNIGGILDANAR
jgi:hypothetical protein